MIEFFKNQTAFSTALALSAIALIMTAVAYCIYFERKISAWMQDRRGPNRVGPFGLLQPLADGAKFLLKEDYFPDRVDKRLFLIAPAVMFIVAMIGFVVVPWAGPVDLDGDGATDVVGQVADPGIGVLYVLAVGGLGVYGVVLGGWASNNKYSFYGAIRATAQMLSYEIPLGVVVLTIVLATGHLRLGPIVDQQAAEGILGWNVFKYPLAALLLLICQFAEANRTPFDLAEAEQELVGGYHTEYSAMKFALFFLAEYAHMITSSAILVVLFFGGWHFPLIPWAQLENYTLLSLLIKPLVIAVKVAFFIFFYMWVRWTLPRFRFDQLMRLAWRGFVPVSLALFVLATVLVYLGQPRSWWALAGNGAIALIMLAFAAAMPTRVTGRQDNMPEIFPETNVRRTPKSSGFRKREVDPTPV
jgi:NADH-quinone oxidoreductase subunit H